MISPELSPIAQAYREIPEKWYEQYQHLNRFSMIANAVATGVYIGILVSGNDQITYHLIGAGVYVASAVTDNISTRRALDAINKASAYGISAEHCEGNPELQGVTTSKDFNSHPKKRLMDIVGLTASAALPNIAALFSVSKFMASLSNFRVAGRYNRAAEIAISRLGTK